MTSKPRKPTLSSFLAGVRAQMGEDITAAGSTRDFADVVARAGTLDRRCVPADWREASKGEAVPSSPELADASFDARIHVEPRSSSQAAFLRDVIMHIDEEIRVHAVGARHAASTSKALPGAVVDGFPAAAPAGLPSAMTGTTGALADGDAVHVRTQPWSRRGVVTIALVVAAACTVFWVPSMVRHVLERDGRDSLGAASRVVERDTTPSLARPRTPRKGMGAERSVSVVQPPAAPSTVATVVAPAPETASGPLHRSATATSQPTGEVSIAALEAAAERAWRAGDLDGAAERYEAIVRRGGRSVRAELAFGDLFALALQSGDKQRLTKLWRRYLVKFPRGRFADDAQAGSCRTMVASKRDACWQDYLRTWPRGTHHAEARRAAE